MKDPIRDSKEYQAALQQLLLHHPKMYNALVLYLGGMPSKKIAENLGISRDAAFNRLNNAKKKMKSYLGIETPIEKQGREIVRKFPKVA